MCFVASADYSAFTLSCSAGYDAATELAAERVRGGFFTVQLPGAVGWRFGRIAGAGEGFNQRWFRRLVAVDVRTRLSSGQDVPHDRQTSTAQLSLYQIHHSKRQSQPCQRQLETD